MRLTIIFLFFIPLKGLGQPLFTLLYPQQTGIRFQNNIIESPEKNVLAYEYFYNGGGVAVGDLNNDGLTDIVFTANIDQPKIYFNKGNFVFEDVTGKSKVRAAGWKTGVTMVDINNDGWLDVYICRSGNWEKEERTNLLFINQQNGTFKEKGADYGVDDPGHSTHSAFFDFDRDGDLDLFVLNHSVKRYRNFDVAWMKSARDSLAGDKLFRNDNGHFTDISKRAGIIGNPICFGLGVAVADLNRDGWPDLYVTNDYDEDDYLYINQQDGTFKESASSYLGHTSKFSMGCDVADINNDGLTDVFTLDMLPEDNRRQKLLKGPDGYDYFQMLLSNGYYHQYMRNMLHLAVNNNEKISFSEIGQLAGVSNTDWSWSALFGDYDLDGMQDLFITNGYMRDYTNLDYLKYIVPGEIKKARAAGNEPDLFSMVKKMPASDVKNYVFKNTGNLAFENATAKWGMDEISLSHGAAYADFDNDGDLDLVVNNTNKAAFIWQNHAEDLKNHYLKIKLKGEQKNTVGIGACVTLSTADEFTQIQEMQLSRGFQSSVEPCLLFGLGKRPTINIEIKWPSGKKQIITEVASNQTIILEEKNAIKNNEPIKPLSYLFTEVNNEKPLFTHVEDNYNDFKREPLIPHQFSKNGPALVSADVNGDGKIDFFAGGAKGQQGKLFLNDGDGKFTENPSDVFTTFNMMEMVDAVFADFDKDGDQDLYVVNGGNESGFEDQVFWNDGKGNFSHREEVLPVTRSSGGAVVAFDMDGDGDLDIFRGGQVTTGAYPQSPESYLLQNDNGFFKIVTPGVLKNIGMISSVAIADLNKDGIGDLIIAGEFMPVTILKGMGKAPFFNETLQNAIPHSSGWWNCIKIDDIDEDGDLDIIAGNHGLNSQMKPAAEKPVSVDAGDFDNNGSMDALISYFIGDKSYPLATRDEFLDQLPSFKVNFPSYKLYADATIKDILTTDQLNNAIHLEATEFRSGVFINDGESFQFQAFSNEAQVFPVQDLLVHDYDKDSKKDILIAGNNYAVRAQSGRYDAGKGLLLLQKKEGVFVAQFNSGFHANRDARKLISIDKYIIAGNNNDKIQVFHIN